jgi:molybdate transport system substrate-binding protein
VRRIAGAVVVVVAAVTTGCADAASPPAASGAPTGEVLISAAASLTDAFAAIETAFEAAHPEVDVVLNLAGSSALREQILQGAPLDVFASADVANMDAVVAAGAATDPTVFARNRLEIAVPAGNPAGIGGLADFGDPDRFIGLCAPGVPCGDFARQVLDRAGVTPSVDTNEPDVRALLTKIEAGELDAGITYVTDVAAAGSAVAGIAIPDTVNVTADYPIAVLAGAPNPTGATAFVAFVLSDTGQAILQAQGFASP